ncbi:MAG: hypothetical protein O2923_07850 [Verrucomicrobia bacterium]|nr:hypothetical protein [Verrucomicrobiota bacterium]MDA1086269.1 hypothetical protein [Verrucomicrobiota bacterium]
MIRDQAQFEKEIADIEGEAYYIDYAELFGMIRHYAAQLDEHEHGAYSHVVWNRMQIECSAFNAMLCSTVNLPQAAPLLVSALASENPEPQLLRAIMTALVRYPADEAYRAIARYIDSAFASDALMFAARMDFERSLPYLSMALARAEDDSGCLQIIRERLDDVGLDRLVDDLETFNLSSDTSLARLRDLLADPRGYCPFSEVQRNFLLRGLGLSYE